jgi:hypothetical protein
MSARLKRVRLHATDDVWGYSFHCPGCDEEHAIPVKPHEHGWDWNGSVDTPSFAPSILRTSKDGDKAFQLITVCHSYVRDGRIHFIGDCTHALAGQTVDLPEVP